MLENCGSRPSSVISRAIRSLFSLIQKRKAIRVQNSAAFWQRPSWLRERICDRRPFGYAALTHLSVAVSSAAKILLPLHVIGDRPRTLGARAVHPILRDEVYRLATEALRNCFQHAAAQRGSR